MFDKGSHSAAYREARIILAQSCLKDDAEMLLEQAIRTVRLDHTIADDDATSWLGGVPTLPAGEEWPTWDARDAIEKAIAWYERYLSRGRSTRTEDAVEKLAAHQRALGEAPHRPLTLLAQLDLSTAGDACEAIGLPASGHLWFFQDKEYAASAKGSFRVLYSEALAADLRACLRSSRLLHLVVDQWGWNGSRIPRT